MNADTEAFRTLGRGEPVMRGDLPLRFLILNQRYLEYFGDDEKYARIKTGRLVYVNGQHYVTTVSNPKPPKPDACIEDGGVFSREMGQPRKMKDASPEEQYERLAELFRIPLTITKIKAITGLQNATIQMLYQRFLRTNPNAPKCGCGREFSHYGYCSTRRQEQAQRRKLKFP